MNHHRSIFEPNYSKKTHHNLQYPNDFHFYYQKSENECIDQMSPTSTCSSEGKSTYWQSQSEEKMIESEMHQSSLTTVEFGSLQGGLLGRCIQKYSQVVSDHIKQCLNYDSDKIYEFVLVREFQGMDLQKQEFSNILTKYYQSNKSTNSQKDNFFIQNSTLWSFMEEITYLNYQEINFELIFILTEIYSFRKQGSKNGKETKEFLDRLSQEQRVQYLNFNFMRENQQNNKQRNSHFHFLEELYEIVSQLYLHYKVFQNEQDDQVGQFDKPQIIRNQLKLFSSQRDIWDSDEEDQFLHLSFPRKKVKYFGNE